MSADRGHFGVTVMPEYIQSEGVQAVLDRVVGTMGANAIVTSPYVAEPCAKGEGGREPPIDAGAGKVRLLGRPLWGKRELFMRTAPSFAPDASLYSESPYAPPPSDALTGREGDVLDAFIEQATARGVRVYFQVMAAIPPCYRVQFGGPSADDTPLMPDGMPLPDRVDNNASLAASDVRAYLMAMLADLARRYPDIAGFKFDWPEYPPYHALSLLADYNPQVRPISEANGIDFDRLQVGMAALVDAVRRGDLDAGVFDGQPDAASLGARLAERYPVLTDHLRLRRALVSDYARFLKSSVDMASDGRMETVLQGFPPPWNSLSGFSIADLEPIAGRLAIKFYTMHWPMMLRNYAEHLQSVIQLDVAGALGAAFVGADWGERTLDDLAYPEPDAAHGVAEQTIISKYGIAQAQAKRPIVALAHGYGSTKDVAARFRAAWDASGGHVEVNRYAYLGDDKITAIGEIARR